MKPADIPASTPTVARSESPRALSSANPAVTIGRAFSDTYVGIAPSSVLPFILAQLVGGAIGFGITKAVK